MKVLIKQNGWGSLRGDGISYSMMGLIVSKFLASEYEPYQSLEYNFSLYKVIDERKFFIAVLKYGIEFEEV